MWVKQLKVVEENPYNAEPPSLVELVRHPITPLPLVYARNHSIIPDLRSDADHYTVKVDGIDERVLTFKFAQLRDGFPQKHVLAVLVCAGNRRAKMAEKTGRDVKGIKWSEGIIANVRWTGVLLRDILLHAGVPDDPAAWEGRHACFASHVAPCQDDGWYGGSIPLDKAMRAGGDVLLAYEMNGESLAPDHGFPLRVVVPGCGGMRWVKWVDRITVSHAESPNFYQQRDYRILPDHVTCKEVAEKEGWWSRMPSMQNLPCNSVVAGIERVRSSCLDEAQLKVHGYAYSDCPIARVEMSVDGGANWNPCEITYQDGPWSWALWRWEGDVGPMLRDDANGMGSGYDLEERGTRKVTVLSRAIDDTGRVQGSTCPWNLRGVGYSGAGEAMLSAD